MADENITVMADESIAVENRSPINVTVSSSGVQGPPPLPSEVTVPLSPSQPVVPEFGTTNIWNVSGGSVPVVLPSMPTAFNALIQINGIANIVWPGGTIVRGNTNSSTAWVTVIRRESQWEVLIPSDEPIPAETMRDSGDFQPIAGASLSGVITYSKGDASLLSDRFTPFLGPKTATSLTIRRMGSQVSAMLAGFMRTATNASERTSPLFVGMAVPSWARPVTSRAFVVVKSVNPGPDATLGHAYVGVTSGGIINVGGMNEGDVIGDVYVSSATELGPAVITWQTIAPWPAP